jgi:hypothetical protein
LYICKGTTNLEFNELFFVKLDQPDQIRKAQRKAFLNFAKLWINNYREAVVNKFSLRLSMPEYDSDFIKGCIDFATQYGGKELELDFSNPTWNNNNIFYNVHNVLFELPTDGCL